MSSINWTQPSWDLFIVLFFIVGALLYGLSLEKERIIVILISIYMALAVLGAMPFLGRITGYDAAMPGDFAAMPEQVFVFKITAFLGIFLGIFLLLSYSVNLRAIARTGLDKWWEVFVFSFLHVGLLISIVMSFLPADVVSNFTAFTRVVFVESAGRFLWTVAPIVAMVLVKSKK